MRQLVLTAILTLISNIALCQTYNIKFEVIKHSTETMGKHWNMEFEDFKFNPPLMATFDGKVLKLGTTTETVFNVKAISVKKVDLTKESYGNTVKTGEEYIIGVQGKTNIEYYIIRKSFFEDGGHVFFLYQPLGLNGFVYSYDIYRSSFIN